MANYIIDGAELTAIADAIRDKNGSTDTYTTDEMPTAIAAIESGSGGGNEPTTEDLTFSGECNYLLAGDRFKWVVDNYKDKISFVNVTKADSLLYGSSYDSWDIDIAVTNATVSYMFANMTNLKALDVKITGSVRDGFLSMFQNCYNLKTIGNIFENLDMSYFSTSTNPQQQSLFYNCYSLREIDEHFWDNMIIARTNSYGHLYSGLYYECACLDKAMVPVETSKTLTSNCFSSTCFQYLTRVQDILFITNVDDSPKTAAWSNQTIDLGNKYVGYCYEGSSHRGYILNYNSGITADKEVVDDATYQALKDDADWFTRNYKYSRYNHDSAVRTINSLPDTSAYLATAGGTNTIKFTGAAGSATDGGAINTLTEEEIAVATAKGWTITLV